MYRQAAASHYTAPQLLPQVTCCFRHQVARRIQTPLRHLLMPHCTVLAVALLRPVVFACTHPDTASFSTHSAPCSPSRPLRPLCCQTLRVSLVERWELLLLPQNSLPPSHPQLQEVMQVDVDGPGELGGGGPRRGRKQGVAGLGLRLTGQCEAPSVWTVDGRAQ